MNVNNYECGLYDDDEVFIQTTPQQLEATNGKVYLAALELRYLLSLVEKPASGKWTRSAGRRGVLDLGTQVWKVSMDAGWIVYEQRNGQDRPVGVVEYRRGFSEYPQTSYYYELVDERFFVFRGDKLAAPEGSYRIDENDGNRHIPIHQ